MPAKNQYSVSAILRKILQVYDLEESNESEFKLNYALFKRTLMTFEHIPPVISYERTAKEKYNLLMEFGFISRTELLNVSKVQEYLDTLR